MLIGRRVGYIESETSGRVSERTREIEREREREDELTLSLYNKIQKSVVGVEDATLWKGPHMTALKLAAAGRSKSTRRK